MPASKPGDARYRTVLSEIRNLFAAMLVPTSSGYLALANDMIPIPFRFERQGPGSTEMGKATQADCNPILNQTGIALIAGLGGRSPWLRNHGCWTTTKYSVAAA